MKIFLKLKTKNMTSNIKSQKYESNTQKNTHTHTPARRAARGVSPTTNKNEVDLKICSGILEHFYVLFHMVILPHVKHQPFFVECVMMMETSYLHAIVPDP